MKIIASLIALMLMIPQAYAGPIESGVSFQGQIKKTNGQPLSQSGVVFQLSILSPHDESCVLYEEQQVIDMASSEGKFDIVLGKGNKSFSGNSNPTPGLTLSNVFDNSKPKSNLSCVSGNSYSPQESDIRKFKISFYDGSSWTQLSAVTINAAPYAEHASTLQGLNKDSFLKVNTTKALTQSHVESVFDSEQMVQDLIALINGTSSKYLNATPSGSVSFTQPPVSSTAPTADGQLANKAYVDSKAQEVRTDLSGSVNTLNSSIDTKSSDALIASKSYTDSKVSQITYPQQTISSVQGLTYALASKLDVSSFVTCLPNQVAIFSSPANSFSCSNISSLPAGVISSGTIDAARLPVGTTAGTVAAGNDSRFGSASKINSIPVSSTIPAVGATLVYDGTNWVPQVAQTSSIIGADAPIGSIIAFPGTCPVSQGYMLANGTTFTQSAYPNLYTALGNSTTLPNLQGVFLRGAGSQTVAGFNHTGNLNGLQGQDWKGFYFQNTLKGVGNGYVHDNEYMGKTTTSYTGKFFGGKWETPAGAIGVMWDGGEVRPANYGVNYCIKALNVASADAPGDKNVRIKFGGTATRGQSNCTGATCTIQSKSSNWAVTSVTRYATGVIGVYSVNFPTGTFPTDVTCVCSGNKVGAGGGRIVCDTDVGDGVINVTTIKPSTEAPVDSEVQLICLGSR